MWSTPRESTTFSMFSRAVRDMNPVSRVNDRTRSAYFFNCDLQRKRAVFTPAMTMNRIIGHPRR